MQDIRALEAKLAAQEKLSANLSDELAKLSTSVGKLKVQPEQKDVMKYAPLEGSPLLNVA